MQKPADLRTKILHDLAQRYGVSTDAVASMLQAILHGRGTSAQFNHPDFGGFGQWVQDGSTMIGDTFNYALKSKVEGLCQELARLTADPQSETYQALSRRAEDQPSAFSEADEQTDTTSISFRLPAAWWPTALGIGATAGSQNNIRYAYFPFANRLAVDVEGRVTVYNTLDYKIYGFSQQHENNWALTFTSQFGLVWVDNLPIVAQDENEQMPIAADVFLSANEATGNFPPPDVFAALEKLADLRERNVLTDDEFVQKKTELLKRI